MIMTQDKARKIAIRQRMAETGEPYSVARHAVEDEYVSSAGRLESPADLFEGMTGDAGEAEALPQEQAWRLAEQARYLAEQARIRAERASEAADRAEEAAGLTQEAAELTQEWASDEEIDRALSRADEARTAAGQARSRAEQAERLAEEAEEAADRAEQAIDEAGHLADVGEEGPPRWHHHPSRPAQPPRPPQAPQPPQAPEPPRPPRIHHDGPQGQDDWPQQHPDPVERLHGRVDQFIQRLSSARDQAGRLISAAERIFTPAPPEPVHSEPASESGAAGSA
jgi:hypothetical protein